MNGACREAFLFGHHSSLYSSLVDFFNSPNRLFEPTFLPIMVGVPRSKGCNGCRRRKKAVGHLRMGTKGYSLISLIVQLDSANMPELSKNE